MANALIIRHAHRMPMPSELGERADVNFDENQVSISEIGAELARDFGMSLHGKYDAIFHSPVLRCKQTAEKISASSGIPIAGELKFLSSEFFDQLIAANESLKKDVISEMLSNSGAGYDRNDLFKNALLASQVRGLLQDQGKNFVCYA